MIKKECFAFIVVVAFVIFCVAMAFKIKPKNEIGMLYDRLSPSVAYIQIYEDYDAKYPIAEASGFLVDEGILMTAGHVTADANRIDIYFGNVDEPYISIEIITPDSNDDVGFVYFEADDNCPEPLEFDDDEPYCGLDVICIGSPLGGYQRNTISKGILSGMNRTPEWYEGKPLYQMDAAATFGNSGCPVFDLEGEVIGMVVSGRMLGDICFLVPDDVLAKYADEIEMP